MAKRAHSRPGSQATKVQLPVGGWLWAVGSLATIACVAALGRAVGIASAIAGVMVMAGAGMICAVSMLRAHSSSGRGSRITGWVATAAVAVLASIPGIASMLPGAGIVSGHLNRVGDKILLGGLKGPVRVLVSGALPGDSTASARYVLAVDAERIEGTFERSIRRSWHKMGRFYDEHTSQYHALRISPGAYAIELQRVDGLVLGEIRVRVFQSDMPGWGLVLLSVASLALAAVADAAGKQQGTFAVHAGIGVIVGGLARWTATPDSALGSAIASVAFGTPLGTGAGLAAATIARRMRTWFVTRSS